MATMIERNGREAKSKDDIAEMITNLAFLASFPLLVALDIGNALLSAFVTWKAWEWFVVPYFHGSSVGYLAMLGAVTGVRIAIRSYSWPKETPKPSHVWATSISATVAILFWFGCLSLVRWMI